MSFMCSHHCETESDVKLVGKYGYSGFSLSLKNNISR